MIQPALHSSRVLRSRAIARANNRALARSPILANRRLAWVAAARQSAKPRTKSSASERSIHAFALVPDIGLQGQGSKERVMPTGVEESC